MLRPVPRSPLVLESACKGSDSGFAIFLSTSYLLLRLFRFQNTHWVLKEEVAKIRPESGDSYLYSLVSANLSALKPKKKAKEWSTAVVQGKHETRQVANWMPQAFQFEVPFSKILLERISIGSEINS